jgi:hypothetical protein
LGNSRGMSVMGQKLTTTRPIVLGPLTTRSPRRRAGRAYQAF